MSEDARQAAIAAFAKAIEPLVRLLLDLGVGSKEAEDVLRTVYVNTAAESLRKTLGKEPSASLVAMRSGLQWREVAKRRGAGIEASERLAGKVVFARVLDGWRTDPAFASRAGAPAVLRVTGPASFESLVARFAPGQYAPTLLDELLRVGAVERRGRAHVKLVSSRYSSGGAEADAIALIGEHSRAVLEALRQKLGRPPEELAALSTLALDIDPRMLRTVQRNLAARAAQFVRQVREYLDDDRLRARGEGDARMRIGVLVTDIGDVATAADGADVADVVDPARAGPGRRLPVRAAGSPGRAAARAHRARPAPR